MMILPLSPRARFDILGLAKVLFQFQGNIRQGPGLVIAQARGLRLLPGQGHFQDPSFRSADEGYRFVGHSSVLERALGVPGNRKQVRGIVPSSTAYSTQPPDSRNQDGLGFRRLRVEGKHDAAGPGGHHGQDSHGHGQLITENSRYFQ